MIRHRDHCLFTEPQLPHLHDRSDDRECLARTDHMVQKRAAVARDNAMHRVFLVRFQLNCRIHAGEFEITSVITRQARAIEQSVVRRFQFFAAFGRFEDPCNKRLFDLVLFFPRRDRLRLIDDSLFLSIFLDGVIDRRCPTVHCVHKQPVCGCALGAVHLGLVHLRGIAHVRRLIQPPGRIVRVIEQLHVTLMIPAHPDELAIELFIIRLIHPRRAESHGDLARRQWLGLHRFQCGHIPLVFGLLRRDLPCAVEFGNHFPG